MDQRSNQTDEDETHAARQSTVNNDGDLTELEASGDNHESRLSRNQHPEVEIGHTLQAQVQTSSPITESPLLYQALTAPHGNNLNPNQNSSNLSHNLENPINSRRIDVDNDGGSGDHLRQSDLPDGEASHITPGTSVHSEQPQSGTTFARSLGAIPKTTRKKLHKGSSGDAKTNKEIKRSTPPWRQQDASCRQPQDASRRQLRDATPQINPRASVYDESYPRTNNYRSRSATPELPTILNPNAPEYFYVAKRQGANANYPDDTQHKICYDFNELRKVVKNLDTDDTTQCNVPMYDPSRKIPRPNSNDGRTRDAIRNDEGDTPKFKIGPSGDAGSQLKGEPPQFTAGTTVHATPKTSTPKSPNGSPEIESLDNTPNTSHVEEVDGFDSSGSMSSLNPNATEYIVVDRELGAYANDPNDNQLKISYRFCELKKIVKRLDEAGTIKCNVPIYEPIKRIKTSENPHIIGKANLIPKRGLLHTYIARKCTKAFCPFPAIDQMTEILLDGLNKRCVPIIVDLIHDPDYYTIRVHAEIEILVAKLYVSRVHPKYIQFMRILDNLLNTLKSLFRECLRGEINHIMLDDWLKNRIYLADYTEAHKEMKGQNTVYTDTNFDNISHWYFDQLEVYVNVNTRRDLYGNSPCYMLTDVYNPFPRNISVNSRGNIFYQFRYNIYVELTLDMGIRLICPDLGIFMAVSAYSTNFSILHPHGRATKKKGAIQIQSLNKGVHRYARITKEDQLLFTKSTSDVIFELTHYALEKTDRKGSVKCQIKDDTVEVIKSEGRNGPSYAVDCMHYALGAKYEHAVKNDNIILNAVKIVQMPNDNISIFRDMKTVSLQILPSMGICHIRTPDYVIKADLNPNAIGFMIKQGSNRVLVHQDKFIVRRGGLSAGYDELNCLRDRFKVLKYELI